MSKAHTEASCPECGEALEWRDCEECEGRGWLPLGYEDPRWYDGETTAPCPACKTTGGHWYCPAGVVAAVMKLESGACRSGD